MLKRLVCIACVVIVTGWTWSAPPTTAPSNDEIVTRVYDISDLLWSKSDYYAPAQTMQMPVRGGPGNLFGGGEGYAPQPNDPSHPSRQDMVDNIVKLLKDTIAPETWKDNGG